MSLTLTLTPLPLPPPPPPSPPHLPKSPLHTTFTITVEEREYDPKWLGPRAKGEERPRVDTHQPAPTAVLDYHRYDISTHLIDGV